MSEKVSFVNVHNLRIARENIGYSTELATEKIFSKNFKIDRIKKWEESSEKPTWTQLKKMSKIYDLNVFLLTNQKNISKNRVVADFRSTKTIDEKKNNDLSKYIKFLIDRQKYLKFILLENGYKKRKLIGIGNNSSNPKKLAELMIQKLGYEYGRQYRNPGEHIKYVTNLLEEKRVFVMKTLSYWRNIEVSDMRGIYLKDSHAPIIALNRKDSKTAQLFTLVHEMAHLFRDKEGISNISFRATDNKNFEEVFCNKTAADFLLPEEQLLKSKYKEEDISKISTKLQLSELFVFFRLKELNKFTPDIDLELLQKKIESKSKKNLKQKDKKEGGNFNNNMRDSNGKLFNHFVSSLYFNKRINAVEANNILRFSVNKI